MPSMSNHLDQYGKIDIISWATSGKNCTDQIEHMTLFKEATMLGEGFDVSDIFSSFH